MSAVTRRDELLRMIEDKRAMADRARRLSRGLSLDADRDLLLGQATALEAEIVRLERELADLDSPGVPVPPSGVHQVQQQAQQQQVQQQESPTEPDDKPKS